MKSSEYWKKRFEDIEKHEHEIGTAAYAGIEEGYREAQKNIESEIAKWYQRFADNNGVSLQEARKLLISDELKELKWDINEYIKHGKENAIDGRWVKQLENASAKFHINRLEALQLQTQQHLEKLFGNQLDSVDNMIKDVYTDAYYRSAFEIQKGLGVGSNFTMLDENRINKVINKPWAVDGKNFSDRIWTNKQKLVQELNKTLTQNIILGQDPQVAIDKIAKSMNVSKSVAGRLVMTEQAAFASAAQKDCFDELEVEQYEIVATLDSHTSEICQDMDGEVFKMSDWEVGVTAPPFHVYCRTTTVPYFDENFDEVSERAARDEEGKTYYVPENMKYEEWKESQVDRNIDGLTKVPQKGTMRVKDDVMKGLADVSEVKSNNDIQAFAEQLIDNLNINKDSITISVKGITNHGYCVFGQETTEDIIHYEEYVLNANDKRSMTHRVKTAFHESFHLLAEGLEWDGFNSSGRIKAAWRSLEETFTESAAHYMLGRYGVSEKIAPSYPKELVTNLPRLKQLPKYSSCNTIQDFGEIAFIDRQNGVSAKWIALYEEIKKVKLTDDYYKQYHEYIINNEDDLFDMFLGNMPGFEQYRSKMKIDLKSAMDKDKQFLNDNEQTVYYGILSCAMQKVGVK